MAKGVCLQVDGYSMFDRHGHCFVTLYVHLPRVHLHQDGRGERCMKLSGKRCDKACLHLRCVYPLDVSPSDMGTSCGTLSGGSHNVPYTTLRLATTLRCRKDRQNQRRSICFVFHE